MIDLKDETSPFVPPPAAPVLKKLPKCNVHTHTVAHIQEHPVRKFFERGIPIAIGDDDPITSRTQVSNELTLLQGNFGFTVPEIIELQEMTLQSAFLQDSDQQNSLRRLIAGSNAKGRYDALK